MIQDRFETFYIVESVDVPSGHPPPHDTLPMLTDGREVKGLFKLSRSDEVMVAMAQRIRTMAKLIVDSDAPITVKSMVRRASTNIFYKIEGDAKVALPEATAQISAWVINEIDRPPLYERRPDMDYGG